MISEIFAKYQCELSEYNLSGYKFYTENIIAVIKELLFLIFFVVLAYISTNNLKGFVVAGGDYYQILSPIDGYKNYIYGWSNVWAGQGAFNHLFPAFPYYTILAFSSFLGIDITFMQLFIITYGSFLSFKISIRYFNPRIKRNYANLFGIVYSLNPFTENLYHYSWAFCHHLLIIIVLPLIILVSIRLTRLILFSKKNIEIKDFAIFGISLVLFFFSLNNIAFSIPVFLIFILYFFISIIIGNKIKRSVAQIVFLLTVMVFIFLLVFGPYFMGFYIANRDAISTIHDTQAFGGSLINIVKLTSNSILNIFLFDINGFNFLSSPINLRYMVVLLLLFLINVGSGVASIDSCCKEKQGLLIFLFIYLIFCALAVRSNQPFQWLNDYLFQFVLFGLLRSPDKIFFITMFSYITLIVLTIDLFFALNRKINFFIFIMLGVMIMPPISFFDGRITEKLEKKKIVKNKEHSLVVKIPDEYKMVMKDINHLEDEYSVISLPYSVVNSLNWSNYPKWGFIGSDVLSQLYKMPYISANSYDHLLFETRLSFYEFNEEQLSHDYLLKIIQNFSGRFVFFHRDIDADWLNKSKYIHKSLELLRAENKLILLSRNDFFDLYKVNDKFFKPIFRTLENQNILSITKLNPGYYRIKMVFNNNNDIIIFNQSFNKEWKIFLSNNPSYDENMINLIKENRYYYYEKRTSIALFDYLNYAKNPQLENHFMVNNYANAWQINLKKIPSDYISCSVVGKCLLDMILYFRPQYYINISIVLNFTLLFGFSFFLIIHRFQLDRTVMAMVKR